MAYAEIDVKHLRNAINAILDYIVEDLGLDKVPVEEDGYWDIGQSALYDLSKDPNDFSIGSLADDIGFSKLVQRGQSGDVPYNLVHIWPQLRYIAEKLKSDTPERGSS
jgi:hypothetical protein